jgi:aryl-alcohol dehydrogenase-like predicted oxidoreductase/predicted kinase
MSRAGWLGASELRIGLGCMRLSTDEDRDEELALATIAAAIEAGITVFDTARTYGRGEAELGHNERLLARALRRSEAADSARIVTKGGMARTGGAWIADGRAKTIRADCEASLVAFDGLPIDLYLIHAPDPRTPWRTSVRALARLVDEGLVKRVGVANVNRGQLDEALELAPLAAVQVPLSPLDVSTIRGGVVERCTEAGIAVIAHSPLGGPRRAGRLARRQELVEIADARGATAAEVALAWLLALSPALVPIPGARRPESARSAARAAELALDADERDALDRAFGGLRPAGMARPAKDAEVVLVMGIPGAGKSRIAEEYAARGYLRLNRDERGGSLRELADALDGDLSAGTRRVVLDNTYLTRAVRSYVVEAASRHGVPARCVWLDTPLAQAQVNLVERLLERFDGLPTPEELREAARREPGVHAPTSQMRTLRELEPPSDDEGFVGVEHVPFERTPSQGGRPGIFVAAAALRGDAWAYPLEDDERGVPHLVFDWRPAGTPRDLADVVAVLTADVSGPVEGALCPHPGGPPVCWCRPPLPGLPLAFARAHGVDPGRSTLVGTSPAHRTLATTLGARYVTI